MIVEKFIKLMKYVGLGQSLEHSGHMHYGSFSSIHILYRFREMAGLIVT